MEDVYVLGIANDYTPPSPSFNIKVDNINLEVENEIDEITKVSCLSNGNIEEVFKKHDNFYATVYLSIDIRIDYMCKGGNINFHTFSVNKLVHVNIGKINNKSIDVDTKILDLDIINVFEKEVNLYIISITSIY